MTVGLAAAGIGGLMANGAWRPSRTLDALATAGAGVMLLTVARNENFVPGTVHIKGGDGRWFTQCPYSEGTYGAEYDSSGAGYDLPECRHRSFNRLNAMWAGVATLGLAVGRWLWRDEPKLDVEVQPGAIAFRKTIGGMDIVAKPAPSPRRTKRRGRHPDKALSAAFVRSAPPGRHADGNGLYLFVQPTGTRSWVQRIVVRGRRRELGLGAAALVPLAEARELALANRKLARSGGDPLSEKRLAEGVPTFAEAAERVLEQKRGGWRGRWHAHNWWSSMERYVFPRVGSRPVSEVNTADVLEILTPIWHVKAATAREVRQRIRSVLEWAIAMDLRNDNPCDRVLPVLGPQNDIVTACLTGILPLACKAGQAPAISRR